MNHHDDHPATSRDQATNATSDRHQDRRQSEKHNAAGGHDRGASHERRMYLRFAAMIATSTAVMFVLTYTNAYAADHVRFSLERLYMALLMGAAMALVMLSFMVSMMYRNRTLNVVVIVAALVVGGAALYASRAQAMVNDSTYMRAMIPHHSIAILTSERADIDDVRVRKLADEIIKAQRREIDEMNWLIDDIAENGPATTPEEADARPVPDFEATAAPASRNDDGGNLAAQQAAKSDTTLESLAASWWDALTGMPAR